MSQMYEHQGWGDVYEKSQEGQKQVSRDWGTENRSHSFSTRGIDQSIMLLATIQTSSRESHYSVTATPVYSARRRKENPTSRLKKKNSSLSVHCQ